MSRKPRLHVDGGFYHVILRGNHRETIFFKLADRERFAELVAENVERFRMRVHAYCWMSNHAHLLNQVADVPLGNAMMRIAGGYSRANNGGRRFEGIPLIITQILTLIKLPTFGRSTQHKSGALDRRA